MNQTKKTQAKICIIYCRYSSEQQRDNMSIEAQKHACIEFAAKQGWQILKVYVDEARSGSSDDRAAFQEMISYALKNPVHYILVHKLDRFARNRYDSIKYKHVLRKKGVRVISASQPIIGSGDPTEVLLEAMLEGMDEFYSLNLARESIKGMAENARNGWWNGGKSPFGYKLVEVQSPKGIKRKLSVEVSEAKTVQKIYSLYLAGNGVSKIRNILNNENLMARKRRFAKNLIINILRNEKYVGDMTFGKRMNKRKSPVDVNMEPITIQDTHDALVARDDWNKVQKMLNGKRPDLKYPRAVTSAYLFSGLIECELCGAKFVGISGYNSKKKPYRYYVCNTYRRIGPKACLQTRFNASDVDSKFIKRLKGLLVGEERIEEMVRTENDALKQIKVTADSRIERIEKEIENLDHRIERLFDIIETGDLGLAKQNVAPRLEALQAKRSSLQIDLQELKVKASQKPIRVSEEVIKAWSDLYDRFFSVESVWTQKRFIQSLVKWVKINTERARICYDPSLSITEDTIPISPIRDKRRKNSPPPTAGGAGLFVQNDIGCPTRTRTLNLASKGRCVTITPSGNKTNSYIYKDQSP